MDKSDLLAIGAIVMAVSSMLFVVSAVSLARADHIMAVIAPAMVMIFSTVMCAIGITMIFNSFKKE